MSKVHEATIPIELDGRVYYTANWHRFFLGRPSIEREEYDDDRIRDCTKIQCTEVKHPRVLKELRRLAPKPEPDEPEAVEGNAKSAMLIAAGVCDKPSEYEERMAKRAQEQAKKYGRA